jgi:hypothetical protein
MSTPETVDTGGTVWDAPNQEVVGVGPPWQEGTGGLDVGAASTASAGNPLDEMTKAELLEYAQSRGISPANQAMSKDEIRASIDAAEAEQ